MRFEELNWMDVESYLEQDDRLMIVLGATEQHAYLSLLTDIKIPLALADAASQQSRVLVAPPLNFGSSPYFLDYPGTISFRLSTLMDAVEDILRSVYRQGFRRILVLNGHGGNDGVRARLDELVNDLPDLQLNWYAWWESHGIEAIGLKHNLKPGHANWLEAFPFTLVNEMPGTPKVPPYVPSAIMDAGTTREIYEDGSFGGPYQADDAIMNEIFQIAVGDILEMLKFE
jgi:creatinine amidohydrolase